MRQFSIIKNVAHVTVQSNDNTDVFKVSAVLSDHFVEDGGVQHAELVGPHLEGLELPRALGVFGEHLLVSEQGRNAASQQKQEVGGWGTVRVSCQHLSALHDYF